jgi:TatD DNase family protein
MPDFIDIHCHTNFPDYDNDRDEVVFNAMKKSIWMINVGTDKKTSSEVVVLANKYERGVYAIVGQHPTHINDDGFSVDQLFDYEFYKNIASDPKVVAIGECGLDYFRADPSTAENQKKIFQAQIDLAKELKKPLMLHIRNAYKDAYEILRANPGVVGNVHFFAGTIEEAKMFLDLGFTLSFTGVITFTNDYDEVIRHTPLDMIMSETDAPYVAPAPYRGKRNEPSYVSEVVKKIAEIKNEDISVVKKALVSNAYRLFNLNTSL